MIKKLQILAFLLAVSFLLTEAGKGLHFLVYHIAPIHNENCHHHCSTEDAETEDERCVFSKIQFFPAAVSESPQCCKPFVYAENIFSSNTTEVHYRTTIHYLLRGPPSELRYAVL